MLTICQQASRRDLLSPFAAGRLTRTYQFLPKASKQYRRLKRLYAGCDAVARDICRILTSLVRQYQHLFDRLGAFVRDKTEESRIAGVMDLWNVKHEKLSSCYGQVKMCKLDVLWTRRGLLSPFAAGRHGDGVWGIQGKHPRAEGSMRSMTSIFLSLPPKNVHALAKRVKAVQTL